jgi:4-amino-4-deoxy-L-arabinose transferase-like glycosyltransferase
LLLLSGWCGLLFFYGLGQGDLHKTEGLRVLVSAECLRRGSWIVPTLYGEPLLTKPPGMYAAIALASWPAGRVSETTARLPSALAASATVFLFYWTFARLLGRRAGLAAGCLLPATVLWLNRAPSAEIDMLQLAWVSASLLCWLRALEVTERSSGRWCEWLWWQLALLAVAGGLLTKWTAPAFFYLTVVPVLAWRSHLAHLWRWSHLLSAAVASLPCLAWAAAVVAEVGWPTLYESVRREALQHLSPLHHSRPYPWHETLLFPLTFLASALPWSAAAVLALRPSFVPQSKEGVRRLWQVLCCWAGANLVFWALVPGHHVRHAMPLQPGLAGLAALVWIVWLRGRFLFPPPLWGRVRVGGKESTPASSLPPTPALPHKGGGRKRKVFLALLACWLVVKLVFVHFPVRGGKLARPRQCGEQLAAAVPEGEVLHLCGLKDATTLYYYGRPARRLPAVEQLPLGSRPAYCALTKAEWQQWPAPRPVRLLLELKDSQGGPLVLVRSP